MTIEKRMIGVIAENLAKPVEEVVPNARIIEDLGGDSLDAVELAMAVEDEFGIVVTDDQCSNAATVQDWLDIVAVPAAPAEMTKF